MPQAGDPGGLMDEILRCSALVRFRSAAEAHISRSGQIYDMTAQKRQTYFNSWFFCWLGAEIVLTKFFGCRN
jgi:hypothetical protein